MLEIAREMKKVSPAPKRSLLFLAVTAEEQGLLGSQYYAQFPLYPLDKTLADINLDDMNHVGPHEGRDGDRPRRVGPRRLPADAAARTGPHAAAGRRAGEGLLLPIRSLQLREGRRARARPGRRCLDYIGKPAGYGKQKRDEYTKNDYHSPSDEVKPDWDLSGFAEDGEAAVRGRLSRRAGGQVPGVEAGE